MKTSVLLAVAAGGAVGAVLRHLVYLLVGRTLGHGFPTATLLVNVLGSFAMGALIAFMALRWQPDPALRALLVTGLLGAFTTFSTFSLDIWSLIENGRGAAAALYVGLSLGLGLGALLAGLTLVRRILV